MDQAVLLSLSHYIHLILEIQFSQGFLLIGQDKVWPSRQSTLPWNVLQSRRRTTTKVFQWPDILRTIEMPKQIATSSKLQTVRSCIRKLRQEKKKNATTVLMTILPNCFILRSEYSPILATLPSSRLNYVSSSSKSENRGFSLVTSTIYSDDSDNEGAAGGEIEIPISNSCHVCVVRIPKPVSIQFMRSKLEIST